MMQQLILIAIFIGALGYIVTMVRKQFSSKESGCPKGCGCSQIDIEKIEREMKSKQALKA